MDFVPILADILDDLHHVGHAILGLDYQIQSKREHSREPHAEEGDYARAFSADDPLDDCYSQSWPVIIRASQAPLSHWWTLRNLVHRAIPAAAIAIDGKDDAPSQKPSVKIIRLIESMASDIERTAPRNGDPVSMGSSMLWDLDGEEWQEKLNALGEFCRDVRAIAAAHGTSLGVTAQVAPKNEPPKIGEPFAHSVDFSSFSYDNTIYEFTATAAACVKILAEHWRAGSPSVSGMYLLTETDSLSERLSTIFRDNPAWNRLIISTGKGRYRLAIPLANEPADLFTREPAPKRPIASGRKKTPARTKKRR